MWEYRAKVVRVVDGDTIDVVTDLGFGVDGMAMRLRLLGVDAWEASAPGGMSATEFTDTWLNTHKDREGRVLITTIRNTRDRDKADSFGRYLVMVWDMGKTSNLNQALIEAGMAESFRASQKPVEWALGKPVE